MKRNRFHYQRKLRQFSYLAKQVNRMLKTQDPERLQGEPFRKLLEKLHRLYLQLRGAVAGSRLRRTLAGAAFLFALGASQPLQGQIFADAVLNPFNFEDINDFNLADAADLDNDGDLDLLVSGYSEDDYYMTFKYYENIGTSTEPNFASPVTTPFGLTLEGVTRPVFGDLDNDGDLDILTTVADYYSPGIAYIENIGTPENPVYGAPQQNPFGLTPGLFIDLVELVDLDNDGDLDVLMSQLYGIVRYYENTGTPESPNFPSSQVNPFGLASPAAGLLRFFDLADLDGDGDFDILYHVYDGMTGGQARTYYAPNLGTPEAPQFGPALQNLFGFMINGAPLSGLDLAQPLMVDIDDDGDTDVFMGVYYGGLFFFENIGVFNAPPTSADNLVTTDQDMAYTFGLEDFPFSDPDMDDLALVKVTSLPAAGTLTFNSASVLLNQEIPVADIGLLVFTPVAGEFGNPYASFTFQVSDGEAFSALDYTMSIVVNEASSTRDWQLSAAVTLAPNPAKDLLTVAVQLPTQGESLTLTIRNAQGVAVRQSTASSSVATQFDLASLPAGLYLLEVRANDQWKTVKFVKE